MYCSWYFKRVTKKKNYSEACSSEQFQDGDLLKIVLAQGVTNAIRVNTN